MVSKEANRFLGKIVVARTAQGERHIVGIVVSYCDAPTVNIRRPNGTQANWRADLCEVLPIDDDVAAELVPYMGIIR